MSRRIRSRRNFDFDDAIRLGLQDSDPFLVRNWCRHLTIEYLSTSPLGQAIKLPSLGMKRLSCNHAKYRIESVSINTAASGFVEQNCIGCKYHKQISVLNFVSLGKPWGWIISLLFRTRATAIRYIYRHTKSVIIALFSLLVLLPAVLALLVNYGRLIQIFSNIDQVIGLNIYDRNILTTLAQVNATVFALAFTIPIAATQLEKYRSELSMFSGYHLYYMLFFIFSIFFPILLPSGSNFGYIISILASIICLLLLIPYLKWIKDGLDPLRIIDNHEKTALSAINTHNEKEVKKSVEKLDQVMVKSLSEKDYGIFSKAFEVLPNLARYCFEKNFRVIGEPSNGYIYIGREITRISELAINDRTASQILSEKILLIDTMHVPANESDERTFPLKILEFTTLSWLAKFSIEHENKINAMHPIASILKLSSFTTYLSPIGRKLADTFKEQSINFLLIMPEDIVDWAYSLNETEYRNRYGGGLIKIALLGQSAKFYLRYKERLREKKEGQVWDY